MLHNSCVPFKMVMYMYFLIKFRTVIKPKLTLKNKEQKEFPIYQSIPNLGIYNFCPNEASATGGGGEWLLYGNTNYEPPQIISITNESPTICLNCDPDSRIKSVKLQEYEIVLYENRNYEGQFQSNFGINSDNSDVSETVTFSASSVRVVFGNWVLLDGPNNRRINVTPGSYNMQPDTSITSVQLAEIKLYDSCGVLKISLFRDVSNLSAVINFNQEDVSCIMVEAGNWAVYSEVDYTGNSTIYTPGPRISLQSGSISSVRLMSVMDVITNIFVSN